MESSCQSRSRRVPSPGSLVHPNLGTSNASSFFVHSPHRDERHLNLIMRDAPIQVRIDLRDFIRPRKNPPRGEPDCAYLTTLSFHASARTLRAWQWLDTDRQASEGPCRR